MNKEQPRLIFLDCFRAVAVLAVFACHTLAMIYGYGFIPWNGNVRAFGSVSWDKVLMFPMSFGQCGVAIFFVISGFCIHMAFHQHGCKWGEFYTRRFWRLMPAYVSALILGIVLISPINVGALFVSHDFQLHFFSHLFLAHNFWDSTFKSINPAFWSLAVEAQLYLLYPLLLWMVVRVGWSKVLIALLCLEVGIQIAGANVDCTFTRLLVRSPFGYWFSWSIGSAIAESYRSNCHIWASKLPFSLAMVLACGCYFYKPVSCLWFTLWASASAIAMSKMLDKRWSINEIPKHITGALKAIGRWSYSIYLIHCILLGIFANCVAKLLNESHVFTQQPSPLIALAVCFSTWCLIIPFSALWYLAVEKPGIELGKIAVLNQMVWLKKMLLASILFCVIVGIIEIKILT